MTIDRDSSIVPVYGGGSSGAARGAKSFLTETVSRVRDAGATGQLTVRADSACHSRAVLGTAV